MTNKEIVAYLEKQESEGCYLSGFTITREGHTIQYNLNWYTNEGVTRKEKFAAGEQPGPSPVRHLMKLVSC